jgi:hypothetical protein
MSTSPMTAAVVLVVCSDEEALIAVNRPFGCEEPEPVMCAAPSRRSLASANRPRTSWVRPAMSSKASTDAWMKPCALYAVIADAGHAGESSETSTSSPSHEAVTPAVVTPFQIEPSVRVTTLAYCRMTLLRPEFVSIRVGSRCVGHEVATRGVGADRDGGALLRGEAGLAAGDELGERGGVVLAGAGEDVLRPAVVVAVPLEEPLEVGLVLAALDAALDGAEDAVADGGGAGAALHGPVLEDRERVVLDDDLGGGALDLRGDRGEAGAGGLAALLGGDLTGDDLTLGEEGVEPLGLRQG